MPLLRRPTMLLPAVQAWCRAIRCASQTSETAASASAPQMMRARFQDTNQWWMSSEPYTSTAMPVGMANGEPAPGYGSEVELLGLPHIPPEPDRKDSAAMAQITAQRTDIVVSAVRP